MAARMTNYFLNMIARDVNLAELVPLERPCGDCAVVDGLYAEITDALAFESKEVQEAVSKKWFCHNAPNRACRGNIDRLAAQTREVPT